nr:hypothetical protein [Plasmopara viticola lesion associated mononegaambi virus 8]
MSYAQKIRGYKDTILQQNEMIKSETLARKQMWEPLKNVFQGLVRFKPDFSTNATGIETMQYPDIRAEDLARLQPAQVVERLGQVFMAVTKSLQENREELSALYGEIDGDIDRAIEEFETLKIQQNNEKKGEVFRSNLVAGASAPRSSTPELVVPKPRDDFGPTLPPTPPSAPGKKEQVQPISTGKPKSGTTTLESMLSPTAASKASGLKNASKK